MRICNAVRKKREKEKWYKRKTEIIKRKPGSHIIAANVWSSVFAKWVEQRRNERKVSESEWLGCRQRIHGSIPNGHFSFDSERFLLRTENHKIITYTISLNRFTTWPFLSGMRMISWLLCITTIHIYVNERMNEWMILFFFFCLLWKWRTLCVYVSIKLWYCCTVLV